MKWPDKDEAFLDVVKAIKAALKEMDGIRPRDRGCEVRGTQWTAAVKESLAGPAAVISESRSNSATWTVTVSVTKDSNSLPISSRTQWLNLSPGTPA